MPRKLTLAMVTALAVALIAPSAMAQQDVITDKDKKELDADTKDVGWDAALSVGATFSLTSSDSVVGQPDGETITFGGNVYAGLFFVEGIHDWRNRASLVVSFTETPLIPEFVKSADTLAFESVYYLRVLDWFGPFARVGMETSIFEGHDVQAGEKLYNDPDNPDSPSVTDRIQLTEPFSPFTVKWSLGAFLRPLTMDILAVEIRAGVGARHVLNTENAYVNKGEADFTYTDADGNEVTEKRLDIQPIEDSTIIGGEAGIYLTGKWQALAPLEYTAFAEALFPFYDSTDIGLDTYTGANVDTGIRISAKIFDFLSVDYEFKGFRHPQVVREWQMQHSLLLTLGYTLLEAEVK